MGIDTDIKQNTVEAAANDATGFERASVAHLTPARAVHERRLRNGELLAASTDMGAVTLAVADFEGMIAYYRDALALSVLSRDGAIAVLGKAGVPIMVLRHEPDLPIPSRREAGLFHTAILFDAAASLAATVLTAARHPRSRFVGSSDHSVSEAFYFTDPEENGIELYHDRPRSSYRYDAAGNVQMATIFLDPNAFLSEHLTEDALVNLRSGAADVGHVHLQVGDIPTARAFYVDTLGFDSTAEYGPQALFVSAGGYHHHMAMNVWNSRGAGPRAATLGLGQVEILVPARSELDALVARLHEKRIQVRDDGDRIGFDDPWRNLIEVRLDPHPAGSAAITTV